MLISIKVCVEGFTVTVISENHSSQEFAYSKPEYAIKCIETILIKAGCMQVPPTAENVEGNLQTSTNKQSDAITLDEVGKMIRAKDQFFASATLLIDMLKMRL
jgi:hypothetical protein